MDGDDRQASRADLELARRSTAEAAANLRSTIQRFAGNGDGSSWLDQLAEAGQLPQDRVWSIEEHRIAEALLGVAAERLRHTRAATGMLQEGREGYGVAAAPNGHLPLNRKERYYTGTVLPMIIASDGFVHLHRFLELCGLSDVRVEAHGSLKGAPVQFFTEYSFAESVVTPADVAKFHDRPIDRDTPDLVLVGPDWLVAVEAKVFHRPTLQALDTQMRRQRVVVDYWSEKFGLERDRVAHVLLLPSPLAADRAPLGAPVVTFEQVLHVYEGVAPAYWLGVLRAAVERYSELASAEPTFRGNADALIPGADIVSSLSRGELKYGWMGRSGGLRGARLSSDVSSGAWRGRLYEVRQVPLPANRNWFDVRDFAARVGSAELAAAPAESTEPTTGPVSLHSENGLYVLASLREDGALEIQGQDLSGTLGWDEYEYALTVMPHDLPALVDALGGGPDADVLALLHAERREVIARGERAWLEDHAIPAEFWSRIEPRD